MHVATIPHSPSREHGHRLQATEATERARFFLVVFVHVDVSLLYFYYSDSIFLGGVEMVLPVAYFPDNVCLCKHVFSLSE